MGESRLEIARRFTDLFPSGTSEEIGSLFTDDAEYFDHAFGLRRKGRRTIVTHIKIWIDCIPDFTMTPLEIWEVPEGAVVFFVGKGSKMVKDLPVEKAKGTPIEYRGSLFLKFRGGLIDQLDEIYTRSYQDIAPFSAYGFREDTPVSSNSAL